MKSIWALVLLALVACEDRTSGRRRPRRDDGPAAAAADPRKRPDACEATGVHLIYVVDDSARLYSFDPGLLPDDPFRLVGQLSCDPYSQPFSMAVDRRGVAWVLYRTGNVYPVSILDATCSPSAFQQPEEELFGMGFVTDGPLRTSEKLFVAEDDNLANLDVSQRPAQWNGVGKIVAQQTREDGPELTGTAEGKLFAYFPEPERGFVVELDRGSGRAKGPKLFLEPLGEHVRSFAFAHWGGRFYVFTTTESDRSAVHVLHRRSGRYEHVLDHSYRIVGAGVSTCAPTYER